ncbi:hypothetical protein FRC02_002457 [Tulasnella sp. 418]|nr:hypothetical protein FRC02_002457 [Tulasnella sp. 418]
MFVNTPTSNTLAPIQPSARSSLISGYPSIRVTMSPSPPSSPRKAKTSPTAKATILGVGKENIPPARLFEARRTKKERKSPSPPRIPSRRSIPSPTANPFIAYDSF